MNDNPERIHTIFARLKAHNPTPTTELNYNSPFELLLAVILSAQATDKSVNLATLKLFKVANTPAAILGLGESGLKAYIKTIGLYNTKANHILKTCALLLAEFQGQVPSSRAALQKLPGVGRKTANVILNTAFGMPTIAVDTHIFRIAHRLGLATGKTPEAVEALLEQHIPDAYKKDAHHWLILHGRYICQARKPKCGACFLVDLCPFFNKNFG